jgi:hypothetical protein
VYDPSGDVVNPGETGREYGLMTSGGTVTRRVDPLGAGTFPESQEYATSDVYRERAFVYRRPYLGTGERTQNGSTTPRYFYGWNAQSYLTMRGRGPAWHPADTGGVQEGATLGFVEGTHQGTLTWFILAGRYVRRHAGDLSGQQALSLDLGAGNYARSATRWRTRGPSPLEYLYLTDNLSRIWRYDGNVWTQVTGIGTRSLLWSTRDELWGADAQFVTKCEGDPSNNGDWTLPVPCGDGLAPVSGLCDIAGRMYFFTDDGGVWALQADTTAIPLFRGLQTTRDARNGRNPTPWLDQIYFRSGNSFYRLTGTETAQFEPIGPERVQTNTSPVRGPVGAFTGVLGYYGFAGLYNSACTAPDGYTGPASFLVRFGMWAPSEGDEEGVARFVDGYDGAQVVWEGKELTSLAYCRTPSVVGATPGTAVPRLYCGFGDGTYGWVTQPRNGPNPFDPDSGCDYTTGLSFLRWPRHSMDAPADLKGYLSFDVTGPYLDPYRWVDLQYRVDPDGEGAAWQQVARPAWQTAERIPFPYPTLGKVIEVREVYGAVAPQASPPPQPGPYPPGPTLAEWQKLPTPVVASVVLREQLRPAYRAEYALTLRATDWAPRHDGATSRLTGQQIRALLEQAADAPATLRLVTPDETAGDFTFVTYQERMPQAGKLRRYGQSSLIDVTMVAYRTQPVKGIFTRYFEQTYAQLGDAPTYEDADDF